MTRVGATVTSVLWVLAAGLGLATGGCASAGVDVPDGPAHIATMLDDPALAGTRWGLLAVTTDGQTVAEVHADDRFIPASNAKIFTTAAAFALLDRLDQADPADGTSVRLEARGEGAAPDVVLIGSGDPALGDGPDCTSDCLSELADAVAARVSTVGDVLGDDRLFPDERWGPGWSWEDLQESYGAAASDLTVNDNVVFLEVTPGPTPGEPVRAVWRAGDDLPALDNTAITTAEGAGDLRLERRQEGEAVRLYGRMPVGVGATMLRVAVDDPALSAALRFRRLLEQRGVVVVGETRARHRPLTLADDPTTRGDVSFPVVDRSGEEIARLSRPPLLASLTRAAKVSQNLQAELMLRRLGRLHGSGSRADGLAQVEAIMASAGIERATFDLHDGSGLSVYDRVSPRAMTAFLSWTMNQPWGEAWRATLPVGGRDGTLSRRFVDTPLEGRIFAKTGSLNGVNALAGFLTAASGRTLVFAIYANDRPSSAGSALEVMDRAVLALAAAN